VSSPLPGVDKALVVIGSDMRGTVYGLYGISEQAGVSPWWWFADVPVKASSGVWALEGTGNGNATSESGGKRWIRGERNRTKAGVTVQKSPSVRYRGIFINDEQPALTNWIK